MVSKQGSQKENPNSLEKRSKDGSLQTWEDHRESGDWCAPRSTQVGGSQRGTKKILKNKEGHSYSLEWYTLQGDWHHTSICEWRFQGVWYNNSITNGEK